MSLLLAAFFSFKPAFVTIWPNCANFWEPTPAAAGSRRRLPAGPDVSASSERAADHLEFGNSRSAISARLRPAARHGPTLAHRQNRRHRLYGDSKAAGAVSHSYLKTTNGSTREARRAGKYPATAATVIISRIATVRTTGSFGVIPNSIRVMNRVNATEEANPIKPPSAIKNNVSRNTSHTTWDRRAPSAIRTPISPVRRLTPYDMIP